MLCMNRGSTLLMSARRWRVEHLWQCMSHNHACGKILSGDPPVLGTLLSCFKKTFPSQLDGVSLKSFYKAINKVEPSLIRVNADEATYNLHIMLRLELEIGMVEGQSPSKTCPRSGTQKCRNISALHLPTMQGRAAGYSLVGRRDWVLLHLCAGESGLRSVLGENQQGYSESR